MKTGQLNLPAGTRCVYGSTPLTAASVAALAKVTRDRELALTALVVRAIERERARVSPSDALALERRIVRLRFGGSVRCVPLGARRSRGERVRRSRDPRATSSARARSSGGCPRPESPPADVARFRATFAPVLARELVVSPAPSWLPEGRGVALATSAPELVFRLPTGRRTTIRTVEGVVTVEALDDTTALAALSVRARPAGDRARAAIRAPCGCVRGVVDSHAEGGREQARLRARPAAGARRRRHLVVRAVPLALRAGGRSLARSSPRVARLGDFASSAASRPSRPCRDPSSSRARARRRRAR